MEDQQQPNQPVQAIAVRPPPFSGNRIKGWFIVLESQFETSNINQSATKFRHVISNLPLDVCEKLSDADLTSNDYDALKEKLLNLHSRPEPQIFNDFISRPPCLNTKPSLFLQQIRTNASTWNLPDEFLKTYFLNAMPQNIRASLLTNNGTLDDIAKLADHLVEYSSSQMFTNFNQQPIVNATHHNPKHNFTRNRPDHSAQYQARSQPTNYSTQDVPYNVRSFNPKQRPQVCKFHIYYGNQAKKCKPWCILNNPNLTTLESSRPSSRSSSPNRQGN